MDMDEQKWYSISELHRNGMLLGYKRAKIQELVKMGFIRAKKGPAINCKILISSEEIQNFIDGNHYSI